MIDISNFYNASAPELIPDLTHADKFTEAQPEEPQLVTFPTPALASFRPDKVPVHPYTVNDPGQMANLIALGVDGMFTNFPDRLDAVLGANVGAANQVAARAAENLRTCRAG